MRNMWLNDEPGWLSLTATCTACGEPVYCSGADPHSAVIPVALASCAVRGRRWGLVCCNPDDVMAYKGLFTCTDGPEWHC